MKYVPIFFNGNELVPHLMKHKIIVTKYQDKMGACVPIDLIDGLEKVGTITRTNEEDFRLFYDLAHANEPYEFFDIQIMQGYVLRKQLEDLNIVLPLDNQGVIIRDDALNPEKPAPGIRRNVARTWEGFRHLHSIDIADEYRYRG